MVSPGEEEKPRSPLDELNEALSSGTFVQVRRMLNSLHPADVAHLLSSSTPKDRQLLWQLVDEENDGEVLQYLEEEIRAPILRSMEAREVAYALEDLDTDDMADLLRQLPEKVIREVLAAMDQQDRQRVEAVLPYAEDTAGGLMNTDTITVRPRVTLDVVLRYLRRHDALPPMTDNIIVVNKNDEYLGMLPIATLLVSDPELTVRELMNTDEEPIPADMPAAEVASLFERHDWVTAPVVDGSGKLLGRITIDDVVDVIRDSADQSLMGLGGLDHEEDTFAPVMKTAPRRAVWLVVNLFTAFLSAAVVNLFQDTIEKVVVLAVLMPIVASMGGVAGSQTLTIVIRGMALGHIGRSNLRWLVTRETLVALTNGVGLAMLVATAAALFFGDPLIAVLIATAIIINIVVGMLAGVLLPLLLRNLGVDPALAGSVTLTTVTDSMGFLSFLGLATLFYA